MARHPRDNSTDPLPIPSISWWWRYDPAGVSPVPQRLFLGHLSGFGTAAARLPLSGRGDYAAGLQAPR
jgi:hypothetical protein